MATYVLRRLLLMVPTFLFITVLVFVFINLAPGRPGQVADSSGAQDASRSVAAREGYRLFKEQYNLDKPIVLNFRSRLDRLDVANELALVARSMPNSVSGETEALAVGLTTAQVIGEIANADYAAIQVQLADPGIDDTTRAELRRQVQLMEVVRVDPIRPARPPSGRIIHAEENVENWGGEIVPELIEVAQTAYWVHPTTGVSSQDGRVAFADELGVTGDALDVPASAAQVASAGELVVDHAMTQKLRWLAVQRLTVNARQRVLIQPGERPSPAVVEANRTIVRENDEISRRKYDLESDLATISATITEWNTWAEANSARLEPGAGRRFAQIFTETRFARFFSNLVRFDLGTSIKYNRPVTEVIAEHLPYSLVLSLLSLILAYFISVPLGILAAVRHNQFADRGVGIFLFILYSFPSFFAATLLQTYLTPASTFMSLFPVSGFRGVSLDSATTWQLVKDTSWHLVLPVICMTYGALAALSRYARTGLLDVIRSDYIRTARAKGLSEFVVIFKHAVRNGLIPILTLLGTTLPTLIGGSIIIESIFSIDGMGSLMLEAILARDYNVIMGELLIASILTLIGILLSDISYALVDPRISFD